MLPDPLHPAVVHLPLALAILVPVFALLAAVTIRMRVLPQRIWVAVVLLQVILVGSGWLSLETGEEQEERVEQVVAEQHIEDHEEWAERFLLAGTATLVATLVGLLSGVVGGLGRGVSVVLALAVLAVGVRVGHSGGELVYRHGAANAYMLEGVASGASSENPWENGEHGD